MAFLKVRQIFNKRASVDLDFKTAVSMGMVDGYSTVDKFGVNKNITTLSDPEDVWEFGGLYNYDADGTAPIQYLSSSDAGDLNTISVQGLDIDGNFIAQDVTLNGQNNVTLTTPLWRVYRMINMSSFSINGIAYCHTDASPTAGVPADENVRAIINDGNNQTLMSLYTIPKGKVAFLHRGEIGLELEGNSATLAEYAHCHYESRRYGQQFTVKKAITIFPAEIHQDVRTFPDVIPALTDMKIRVVEVTQTMGVWATFDLMLVDESKFSDEYLASIGQPGY